MTTRTFWAPLLPTLRQTRPQPYAVQRPYAALRQFPEAAKILERAARSHNAPFIRACPVSADTRLGLSGPHQRANAGLALTAWRELAPMLGKSADDTKAQAQGLAQAFMPGRLQRVPGTDQYPPLLLDGAHNPHGMAALIKALRAEGLQPAGAVFSCLADKDWLPPPDAQALSGRSPHVCGHAGQPPGRSGARHSRCLQRPAPGHGAGLAPRPSRLGKGA